MFPSSKNIDGSNIDLTNYYTKTEVNAIVNSQGQAYIPCGTRMGYYGTTAPQGFLLCDGSEYFKTQYPQLAALLAATDTAQSTTLFAGSDAQHFKVPDLRGEFIRGTGTNSHAKSGNGGKVGEHQDGNSVTNVFSNGNSIILADADAWTQGNFDSTVLGGKRFLANISPTKTTTTNYIALGTVRPTSTSENMIIAYQDIYLAPRHQYSTEEHVVGTWIDGKPVYEIVIVPTVGYPIIPANTWTVLMSISIPIDTLVDGYMVSSDKSIPSKMTYLTLSYDTTNNNIMGLHTRNIELGIYIGSQIVLQYTKTTDTIVNS